MTIQNRPIQSIQQVQNERLQKGQSAKVKTDLKTGGQSFEAILRQQVSKDDQVHFSKHANQRLEERHITLTDAQLTRLNTGIDNAKQKGIRESLMLMDQVALVVNVEHKTVVTALSQEESKAHIFTNIDGAVIL